MITFGVRDELIEYGRNEDGGQEVALYHSLIAELPSGRRYANRVGVVTYYGRVVSEPGITVERLQAQAERLQSVQPKLDPEAWSEIDPAYGSQAWPEHEFDLWLAEREEARRYG